MASSPALSSAIQATTLKALDDKSLFDAIVVGAGAAGGMAAMSLSEAGMNVLVLDAGWSPGFLGEPLRRITSAIVPRLASPRLPPNMGHVRRMGLKLIGKMRQPVQSKCFAWEQSPGSLVDDRECPYVTEEGTRFNWFRARQIGGRMVMPGHGRLYFRLGERDLAPDDGLSAAWPLAPGELDPWYDLVEERLGLSGMADDCPWVPNSRLRHVLEPTTAENELHRQLTSRWPSVFPFLGRSAPPLPSLEIAAGTGRLSCRRGAVVKDVQVDALGRVQGVTWFDREIRSTRTAQAPIVFVCASSLETTRILLLSRSPKSPDGLGAASHALGRYLMDHVVVSGEGVGPGLPDEPVPAEVGRCLYLPRFDLRDAPGSPSARGYGIQLYRWSVGAGRSYFSAVTFAEMTPRASNRVVIDPQAKDAFGIPALRIECRHSPEEIATARDQSAAIGDVADLVGVRLNRLDTGPAFPGTAMHECGTARMGDSPETSVLDPNNQCWHAKGLYVTDGSAFPSQGAQNPTLTILALTARASAHAVRCASVFLGALLLNEAGKIAGLISSVLSLIS